MIMMMTVIRMLTMTTTKIIMMIPMTTTTIIRMTILMITQK